VRAIGIDGLDVDLVEAPVAEVGPDVEEQILLGFERALGDLTASCVEHLARELTEGRHGFRSVVFAAATTTSLGRHPEPPPYVGHHVGELLLCAAAIPALRLEAERQVVAPPVGVEPQGVAVSGLPPTLYHQTFGPPSHLYPPSRPSIRRGSGPRIRIPETHGVRRPRSGPGPEALGGRAIAIVGARGP
jgi:hypothetical protein